MPISLGAECGAAMPCFRVWAHERTPVDGTDGVTHSPLEATLLYFGMAGALGLAAHRKSPTQVVMGPSQAKRAHPGFIGLIGTPGRTALIVFGGRLDQMPFQFVGLSVNSAASARCCTPAPRTLRAGAARQTPAPIRPGKLAEYIVRTCPPKYTFCAELGRVA